MQSAVERRLLILRILSNRRFESVKNLMIEFNVSKRTILYDIEILSASSPLYTTRGNGGGIRVVDGWFFGKEHLTEEQEQCLLSIKKKASPDEQRIIQSILQTFSKSRW